MTELPPLDELLASTHTVALKTRTRFRGVSTREAVIFKGAKRWSEFSPFTEYGDEEAATWLRAAIEYGSDDLPPIRRNRIEVNATLPAVEPEAVAGVLARFAGCNTIKVKVAEKGQTLADDIARLETVRALAPNAKLRIDANGGWSLDEAVAAIKALSIFELDYVEQPVATLEDLAVLRRKLGGLAKIAADESVRKSSDPLAVVKARAADLLVIKMQPLGGINRALQIVEEAGLPVVVSSALDSSIGISMGARLAASLPELYGACGLGTAALLAADVTKPLVPHDGAIEVSEVQADELLLKSHAASPERQRWWRERITRCYRLL